MSGPDDDFPWWMRNGALRGITALVVVPGGFVLLVLVWLVRGAEQAEQLAGLLQAVMLTVVGFYFGGLGFDRAEQRAKRAQHEADGLRTMTAYGARRTEELEHRLNELMFVVDKLAEDPAVRRQIDFLMRSMRCDEDERRG